VISASNTATGPARPDIEARTLELLKEKPPRLEIGAGQRPTPGYISNDINAFDGIDIVANPWEICFPDNSLEEVIALGVIEHLTYEQVDLCFANVRRILRGGGALCFRRSGYHCLVQVRRGSF
jgi:hypothetical protein